MNRTIKRIVTAAGVVGLATSLFMASPVSAENEKIVAFGDSNTLGSNWLESWEQSDKWFNRLEDAGYNILNAGIAGNTTEQAKERFQQDVLSENPTDVVIMFGTNDQSMTAKMDPKVSKAQFEENIRYFVSELKEQGSNVVLMTTLPPVKSIYYERHNKDWYAPAGGVQAWNNDYNDIVRRAADDVGVSLVDLHNIIIDEAGGNSDAALINSGLIDETGTHLTPEGAKLVYDYLEPVLEIGHRQSIGNGGVYQQHNNLYVYTVAGDRSKGLIDNYPYNGAEITHEFQRYTGGEWARYKTLSGETKANGRYEPYLYLSSAYPVGDWRIKTTIESPRGAEKTFTTPFEIQ